MEKLDDYILWVVFFFLLPLPYAQSQNARVFLGYNQIKSAEVSRYSYGNFSTQIGGAHLGFSKKHKNWLDFLLVGQYADLYDKSIRSDYYVTNNTAAEFYRRTWSRSISLQLGATFKKHFRGSDYVGCSIMLGGMRQTIREAIDLNYDFAFGSYVKSSDYYRYKNPITTTVGLNIPLAVHIYKGFSLKFQIDWFVALGAGNPHLVSTSENEAAVFPSNLYEVLEEERKLTGYFLSYQILSFQYGIEYGF